MSRTLLAVLCLLNVVTMGCQNRGAQVEPTPETRASSPIPKSNAEAAPAPAPSAPAAPAAADTLAPAVKESIDELSRFVQLPVRPASVFWRSGLMGKNESPEVPGPSDGFLIAVLSYAPADADRLVAAQSGSPAQTEVATFPWFPAALRALAHNNVDGFEVLTASRYDATAYTRAPFTSGALHRIGTSGWFVLALSTT